MPIKTISVLCIKKQLIVCDFVGLYVLLWQCTKLSLVLIKWLHILTNDKMADIHLSYGLAKGDASRTQGIYTDNYHTRQVPHATIFFVDQRTALWRTLIC